MALKSTITAPPVIEGVTQVNSEGDTIIANPVVLVDPQGEFTSITQINDNLGATDSFVATNDIGVWNLNSLIKKINQSFTTLLNRIPTLSNGKIPVDVASLNVTVSNASLEIANDVGNPVPVTLLAESGYLTYRNTALTNTAVQVKASGGSVMGWNFINVNSVAVYVKFFNLASNVTVGTSPVLLTQAVPGGSSSNPGINFLEAGLIPQEVFSAGISIACVTGLADNSNTAPTTPIHASVRYK